MSKELKPTNQGQKLVDTFFEARDNHNAAKRALTKADCALRNAENALGKWLLPNDAKDDEVFNLAVEDKFLQVSKKFVLSYPEGGGGPAQKQHDGYTVRVRE